MVLGVDSSVIKRRRGITTIRSTSLLVEAPVPGEAMDPKSCAGEGVALTLARPDQVSQFKTCCQERNIPGIIHLPMSCPRTRRPNSLKTSNHSNLKCKPLIIPDP